MSLSRGQSAWRITLATLLLPTAGCDRPGGTASPAQVSGPGVAAGVSDPAYAVGAPDLSPEAIAKDPEGYIRSSDSKIEAQVAARRAKLKELDDSLRRVRDRSRAFLENLDEIDNLHQRFARAYRRAEDEDRWPMKVAGRYFERSKAQAVVEQTRKYLEERRPLAQAYRDTEASLAGAIGRIEREVDELTRLREKLALDLERVRLGRGMEELGDLRRTGGEIAKFSQSLTDMAAEETSPSLLTTQSKSREKFDVESFLK